MKIGILGAGNIAGKMATTINLMNSEYEAYAVASRDLSKAESFAKEYSFEKAYGSYEELVSDNEIDLIYVATPHSHHYEHIKLCLEHNKNVLCEKAFTVNAKQAREVCEIAQSKNLLLAEAIWTRYLPLRKSLMELIDSGIIGEVVSVESNIGYKISHKDRILKSSLAGGALLDITIYPINFVSMVLGNDIKNIVSSAVITDEGVDSQNAIIYQYPDNKMATIYSTSYGISDREAVVNGKDGYIKTYNVNNFENLDVFDREYKLIKRIETPAQLTGFEYQVEACKKAIDEGKFECEDMPHSEIIRVMEIMDEIRGQWNMTYECE